MKQRSQMDVLQNNYIKREYTNMIKGVALVFMFFLHFFCWPEWYVAGIEYPSFLPYVELFKRPLDICVPVFAFLTGYFYAFNEKKDAKYSFRKCTDIWITYVVIFIILLIPALATDCYHLTLVGFLLELFVLDLSVMYFCWYVQFYITAIIALPIYVRVTKNKPVWLILIGIIAPYILARGYGRLDAIYVEGMTVVLDNFTTFAVVATGYMVAQFSLYEKWLDRVFSVIQLRKMRTILYLLLAGAAFMGRRYFPYLNLGLAISMDVLYAPVFVYALVNLIQMLMDARPWKAVWKAIGIIGKYSLEMWFFHCVFFNCCKSWSQKILYFPQTHVLVLAWGVICFSAAMIVRKPIQKLQSWKNIRLGVK